VLRWRRDTLASTLPLLYPLYAVQAAHHRPCPQHRYSSCHWRLSHSHSPCEAISFPQLGGKLSPFSRRTVRAGFHPTHRNRYKSEPLTLCAYAFTAFSRVLTSVCRVLLPVNTLVFHLGLSCSSPAILVLLGMCEAKLLP
jgi:hypothetical protein